MPEWLVGLLSAFPPIFWWHWQNMQLCTSFTPTYRDQILNKCLPSVLKVCQNHIQSPPFFSNVTASDCNAQYSTVESFGSMSHRNPGQPTCCTQERGLEVFPHLRRKYNKNRNNPGPLRCASSWLPTFGQTFSFYLKYSWKLTFLTKMVILQ